MFASRCIDYWWQQGGVQLPIDARMHHLSDAFAFVGVMSQARLLTSGASATTTQLRSDDGGTFVELSGGGIVTVTAPTKIVFNTPELHVGGKVTTTGDVTAGTVSLQHHVHQNTQPGSGLSGQPQP
jgi:phage baseplate assembly protein gpV